WHTVLDDETSYLEASATAGFTYGILKAIHKRYVGKEYEATVEKAIKALLNEIDENGTVQNVSIGTGMGDTIDFYKEIGITAMPYCQSLTVLAFAELLVSFV